MQICDSVAWQGGVDYIFPHQSPLPPQPPTPLFSFCEAINPCCGNHVTTVITSNMEASLCHRSPGGSPHSHETFRGKLCVKLRGMLLILK